MFSMCSELTPRARILDTRIPQLMQPWNIYNKIISEGFITYKKCFFFMITKMFDQGPTIFPSCSSR